MAAAKARGLVLPLPEAVTETPGEGVSGRIDRRAVVVGGADFVMHRWRRPLVPMRHTLRELWSSPWGVMAGWQDEW